MNDPKRYPDEKECFALLEEHEALPNILDHSIMVKKVSLVILDHLIEGTSIDRDLIIASALLHDIAKSSSIKTRDYRHDLTGGKILRELGHEKIAGIVERHVFLEGFNPEGPLEEWEIVHYADKRVMHDTIVSIDRRIDDIVERYRIREMDREFIEKSRRELHNLEEKIRKHLREDIDTALREL
jgi:putative nucleotidyltransferase with HDIG domain